MNLLSRIPFALLLISLGTTGCGIELGTPIPTDSALTGFPAPMEEPEEEEAPNPHVGLTAGRPVVVPAPAAPPSAVNGDADLQDLLDQLSPEDSDLIRELIESVVGAPQPFQDESDDQSLSWGALKRRYLPDM